MISCQDVQARAGAWIDGEVPAPAAAAVAAHAATCPRCADALALQRETRALVGGHAAELRGAAPAALRARVEHVVAPPAATVVPFPQAAVRPRRWAHVARRWSVAAALLIAVGGVFVVGGMGGSRLFAAQLALDHYKCLLLDGGHTGVAADALEATWAAERGWTLTVPPSEPALGIALVALRRCIAGEGQMAHVIYDVGGAHLSLFVVPTPVDAAAADLPIMGVGTKTWVSAGRTYALVGPPAAVSDRVVEFMRAHAR